MRLALIVAVWMSLLLCPRAAADQIILTNGDRLTGAIIEFEGERLRMNSELAGEVTVAWAAVAALSTAQPLAVTLPGEQVVVGTLATRNGDIEIHGEAEELTVSKNAVRALRSPQAQARYAARRAPGWLDLWRGTTDAGLSSTRGNSDTLTLTLGLTTERQTEKDKLSTCLNSLFARDSTSGEGETIANTVRLGARYNRNMGERLFTFGFTDFEFDELQQLDLRWVLGGGLGWQIKKTDRTLVELLTGGSLNQEFFEAQPVRRSGEALFGEEISYRLSARTSLRERLTFYPNLSDPGEYRVTADSSAETKLNDWLSWHVTLSERFLSNPPAQTQKNDLLLTTGIRLRFGEQER